MTREERQARSITFRAALEDGVIRACLDDLEAQFTNEWKAAGTMEERENLFRTVRVLTLLRSHAASIIAGEHDGISAIRRIK